jgi:hypothetical protein
MSRPDVVAILGPPGDYRTLPPAMPPVGEPFRLDQDVPPPDTKWDTIVSQLFWLTDDLEIAVYFDPMGDARTECEPSHVVRLNLLDNLLWRLKRQWHRWFPE